MKGERRMRIPRLIPRAGLALLLLPWGAFATADAQHAPRPKVAPALHARPVATKPAAPTKPMVTPKKFGGVATALGTTSAALESAFEAARAENHKLKVGQFISANVLAHDLGTLHSSITTQAILDGLKSGKKLGAVLQALGLSKAKAKAALKTAKREIREDEKPPKPEKPTPPEKPAKQ